MIHELMWAMARKGFLIDFARRDDTREIEYMEFYPVRGTMGTDPDLAEIQSGMVELGFVMGLRVYVDQDTGVTRPSVSFERSPRG